MISKRDGSLAPYEKVVHESILFRFRLVMVSGAIIFSCFSALDWATYPAFAVEFLKVRVLLSSFLLLLFLVSYLRVPASWTIWKCNLAIVSVAFGIDWMIYRVGGASSSYYQGLNIVFLAMYTMNSYYTRHNVGSGLLIIASYQLAVFANDPNVPLAQLVAPNLFIFSTLFFVAVMTRLYSLQHFKEFDKSEKLSQSAARLHEAHEKLLETERLKDHFIANISHEFRTPLSLVLGPVRKYLKLENLGEQMRQDLSIIERNALVLLHHVEDLLQIARLEAGSAPLSYQQTDPSALLRFVASHFENVAAERQIEFTVTAFEPILFPCDPAKVERILFNLFSNAFKFTPQQSRVSASVRRCDSQIEFCVEDNGPGIPQHLRTLIFDRFRQVEETDTKRYGGTGLGLAIVKELVELQKGVIHVDEASPHGARFRVLLPLELPEGQTLNEGVWTIPSERRPDTKWQSPAPALAPTSSSLLPASMRPIILVVEDHPEMNSFIAETLAPEAGVLQAYNGHEGLKMIHQYQPDLIICDMMMPEMSGEELLLTLRQRAGVDHIPVLILSAKAEERTRERLLLNGAQDYLHKPFSTEELRARARNLLTMKKVRDVLIQEVDSRDQNLWTLTIELARQKRELEETLRKNEEVARVKEVFLMNLSHELRTPLTSILGWAELLSQDNVMRETVEAGLEVIFRNARSQLHLVDDLLDLSRIVQGKLKLELKMQDPREIIKNTIESVEAACRVKKIELATTYHTPVRSIVADYDRLQQVMWNLLSNAIKFTPQNGRIEVHVREEENFFTIEVKDSGIGINPEFLPYVFDRLKQEDSSTTKRYGGLGLGLSIARHLMELHGGRIYASSEGKDRGATFGISIPMIAPISLGPELPPSTEQPTVRQALSGIHALIVDDEPDTLKLLAFMLSIHGAQISSAASAQEALAAIEQARPDVVISDIAMAEQDGIWLLEQIKTLDSMRNVAAIALSAFTDSPTRQQALNAGFRSFLNKPVSQNDLIEAVEALLVPADALGNQNEARLRPIFS